MNCSYLETIKLQDNVQIINDYVFAWSYKLSSVVYKDVIYTSKTELETALLNNNVTVYENTFYGINLLN